MFEFTSSNTAHDEHICFETLMAYCLAKIGSFDHETAIKYGQSSGYFDTNCGVTPAGKTLAKFINIFGEGFLCELSRIQARVLDLRNNNASWQQHQLN